MLMTEEQAKEKWCPMVRANPLGPQERYHADTTRQMAGCACLGSNCAMWRWHTTAPSRRVACTNPDATTEAEAGSPPHWEGPWVFVPCDEESAHWAEAAASNRSRWTGFCGLAGNPGGAR